MALQAFSPSVKTFGFATSLIRGRQGGYRNFDITNFLIDKKSEPLWSGSVFVYSEKIMAILSI